jgi:Fe-S cluster assembly iron-binding protein IscA
LGLALDELKENEKAVQINGIDILISDTVGALATDKKVDYVKSSYGEGFAITSPNQTCC